MKKNQNGITLIALVVTIIVLLILAGVSIAMLTGQNGILNRATEAGWQTKLGEGKDTVGLMVSTYLADYTAVSYVGGNSEIDVDWNEVTGSTDAERATDVVKKAVAAANGELKDGGITATTTDGKTIVITYTDNKGQKYSVTGKAGKVSVQWGTMAATK